MKNTNNDMIFGIRAILEAIHSENEIDKLFIQKGLSNPLIKELIQTAKSYKLPISQVPAEKLNRFTRKNHQGAVAFISAVKYASLDNIIDQCYQKGKEPFILILDRVTDVRNFGAIARTAECAGIDAIVIPTRGSAAVNSDAMKTSAGALNHLAVCREENLKITIDFLKNSGIQVVACTEKTDKSIYEVDFKVPSAIILGSEENGVSGEYLKMADHLGKIPMTGKIGSLNVSVSAAVAIYEAVRQKL
ncbi:23S rRNA (guanosine(2251)-2'-O)-methyltransferase RlmB [Fulvivirga sp. RKSG066]|uniref:23S rRNA (guanosine(2251)-2'-O)-methyltransferase RlmB n=1 Tax=Fulvivirga aurantia TaxID=2529383 RepID=UPI0012BCAE8E|nr:23S rRNA (guanosine(2251)-2'-O)-methyltransferase RlmB [Fulvivirga aurantia]MTI22179.1 23S rRNA (guanosine(2251)-2'-O)-methyltransferase RlmB [Fulvivirga aurantia]